MWIYEKARELAKDIKATKEYGNLKQSVDIIKKNNTLRNEMIKFNERHAYVVSGKATEKEAESLIEAQIKKIGELSKIKEIEGFMEASRTFNAVMVNMYKSIYEFIENDISIK